MFNFLTSPRSSREGDSLITKAFDQRGSFSSDIVNFKDEINLPAVAQHLGMLTHLKAWSFLRQSEIQKCVKTLWIDEKDATGTGKLQAHPTCTQMPRQDEVSKSDLVYQKSHQTHPQYYFNNLGVVHMKLKKYNMAIFYLSKAVKFLERSNDKHLIHPNIQKNAKINPNENLNNLASQKSHEIIYNYGLALFKSGKYYEAFKCFEKVSLGVVSQNPKLWYYMSLCALNLNKDLYAKNLKSQSDVFHEKLGYQPPHYVRQSENQRHKRFILAPKGDQISQMESIVKDFESQKIEEQKKAFLEAHKRINLEQIQALSKTQQKKQEKSTLQSWSQTNSALGQSLSIDNAIMYMQNVLSCIEHKIQNELRYTLHFKHVVANQVHKLDLTQQIFHEETKSGGGSISEEDLQNDQAISTNLDAESSLATPKDIILFAIKNQQLPQSQESYNEFELKIRQEIESKHALLIKNAHQYLCYMYLITYNFVKCIHHGKKLLDIDSAAAASSDDAEEAINSSSRQKKAIGGCLGKQGQLAPKTRYNILMYLAEAKCMIGRYQEAFEHLEQAESVSATYAEKEGERGDGARQLVKMVELKFRQIEVSGDEVPHPEKEKLEPGQAPRGQGQTDEKLNVAIINKLNRCVVLICSGQFEVARQKFDEIITWPEENGGLGMKEITCDTESTQMLPSYLISLLAYFYLRTKNLKMARALVKNRRFVADTDHIVQ